MAITLRTVLKQSKIKDQRIATRTARSFAFLGTGGLCDGVIQDLGMETTDDADTQGLAASVAFTPVG